MKLLTQVLTDKVSAAFESCGYSAHLGQVTVSDRADLCQFQCNGSFAAAKLYKKAPAVIAKEIIEILSKDSDFSKVEFANPGFINLSLTDEALVRFVSQVMTDEHLGIPQAQSPQTILVDYGGPNVAKPLHIGHLRSAIIGESLKRLAKATGRNVISDVHLGDWGLQMGLVIAELEERNPGWPCFSADYDKNKDQLPSFTAEELNEIYPFASAKSKQDADFKAKAKSITAALQKGHPGYYALWEEIIRISTADMKRHYQRLNVDFDYWYGESDSEKYVDRLLEILKSKNLLEESEGALVVQVAEETDKNPCPPVIIKKSDDSNIYATTDLATIIQRQQDFAPQNYWYVVDNRQSLHFIQVFRCARKAELVPEDTTLEHLGFGTMNGSDGKPYKTRDGGVMQLGDFIQTVYEAAFERVGQSEFSDKEKQAEIAEKIAVATIKFGDLINHRAKDYIFDMDKFLASEGKTGSFLLYTIARINSILRKAEFDGFQPQDLAVFTDSDRDTALKIALSGEAFQMAFAERAPNYICENAYQIASAFSKFYHDNHILTEKDETKRRAWLSLCVSVKIMLEKHLDILGIEPVELM